MVVGSKCWVEGPPKPHLHVESANEVSMMSPVYCHCLMKVERFRLTKKWRAMASLPPIPTPMHFTGHYNRVHLKAHTTTIVFPRASITTGIHSLKRQAGLIHRRAEKARESRWQSTCWYWHPRHVLTVYPLYGPRWGLLRLSPISTHLALQLPH